MEACKDVCSIMLQCTEIVQGLKPTITLTFQTQMSLLDQTDRELNAADIRLKAACCCCCCAGLQLEFFECGTCVCVQADDPVLLQTAHSSGDKASGGVRHITLQI